MADNIASTLWEAAERWPRRTALSVEDSRQSVTFRRLQQRAGRVAAGLNLRDIGPGDRVLVMLKPGVQFFTTMFGILATGATAVLADPGMGYRTMIRCFRSMNPRAVIAEAAFHGLSSLFGVFDSDVFRVARPRWFGCTSWRDFTARQPLESPVEPDEEGLAVLAFTSGSTGRPKPVIMDHSTLAAQVEAIRRLTGVEPGRTQMAFLPLNALLGPGLGCRTVIPSVDPRKIEQLDAARTIVEMKRHEVTDCLGSPFIWRTIVDELRERDGDTLPLKQILIGGAPPDESLVAALCELTDADVHIAYGATEAVPIASVSAPEFLDHVRRDPAGGCLVGRPVEQMEAAVIVDDGDAKRRAEPGEIGEVWIRGPLVSPGYDGFAARDEREMFENQQWHTTGDCARLDEQGRLVLYGRDDHCVDTGDTLLYPLAVEPVLERVSGVEAAALVPLESGATSPAAVAVVPSESGDLRQLAARFVEQARRHGISGIEEVLFCSELPRDNRHNSKILRHEIDV